MSAGFSPSLQSPSTCSRVTIDSTVLNTCPCSFFLHLTLLIPIHSPSFHSSLPSFLIPPSSQVSPPSTALSCVLCALASVPVACCWQREGEGEGEGGDICRPEWGSIWVRMMLCLLSEIKPSTHRFVFISWLIYYAKVCAHNILYFCLLQCLISGLVLVRILSEMLLVLALT